LEKEKHKRVNIEDQLSAEDWRVLIEILRHFKLFYVFIIRLQSRATDVYYDFLWKAFSDIELFLNYIIITKETYENFFDEIDKYIFISFDNYWRKLDEYYILINEISIRGSYYIIFWNTPEVFRNGMNYR
jgi:hypothetical protein